MPINSYATETTSAWGTVSDTFANLILPGTDMNADISCQVGTCAAEVTDKQALKSIETVIILDNSFSIPINERPLIADILLNLAGNRMNMLRSP